MVCRLICCVGIFLWGCFLLKAEIDNKAEPVVIVENGAPKATIVTGKTPTRSAQFAAKELQYHIKKITGADVPIVTEKDKAKGLKIFVGESKAVKAAGNTNESFKKQEYLVNVQPDSIILTGKDEDDRGKVDYANWKTFPSIYGNRGSSLAVYEFLEKFCDFRWFGATELGMSFAPRNTLRVETGEIRRTPAFLFYQAYRRIHSHLRVGFKVTYELWNKPSPREYNLFARRMRWGGDKYSCNHAFNGYRDRFWRLNPDRPKVFESFQPEYFEKGFDPKMKNSAPTRMCYTSSDLVKQVVKDAREYFDGKGIKYGAKINAKDGKFFPVVPRDYHGWCKCDKCKAKIELYLPQGRGVYPASRRSNYIWGFVNKIAKEIGKSHPDKYISALGYQDYAAYPSNVKLESNVSVQLCLLMHYWCIPWVKENDMMIYNSWIANERGKRPIYLWIYNCFPDESAYVGGFNCFPNFQPRTIAKQIKMYHRDGIKGFMLNGLSQQLDHYVYAKMFDNPDLDVDELMDEFFSRYYGNAAKPMRQIYDMIENIYCNPSNYPMEIHDKARKGHYYDQNEEIAWKYLGTEKRMAELEKLMQEAKALAKSEIEKKRVALFENSVLKYMKEGRKQYLLKAAQKPKIDKLKKQEPPFLSVPCLSGKLAPEGDLSKVDWKMAASLESWRQTEGFENTRKINGQIVRDDAYIYVRLEESLEGLKLASGKPVRNGDVWRVCFSERRGGWPVYFFEVNPKGDYDSKHWGKNSILLPIKVASKVLNGKWTVEMAFPMNKILPNGVNLNKPLYANFFRSRTAWLNPKIDVAWSSPFNKRKVFKTERFGKLILNKKAIGKSVESQ